MLSEKEKLKPRLPGELSFCLVMLLFSTTVMYLSYRISGFSGWSSAGSLPMGTSLVMALSSLTIVFRELSKRAPDLGASGSLAEAFRHAIFPVRHIVFIGVLVAYMFLLERLGFIGSSFLYLIAASLVLGERHYVRMLVSHALSLAVVYLIFQTAFSVVLPAGFVERAFQ